MEVNCAPFNVVKDVNKKAPNILAVQRTQKRVLRHPEVPRLPVRPDPLIRPVPAGRLQPKTFCMCNDQSSWRMAFRGDGNNERRSEIFYCFIESLHSAKLNVLHCTLFSVARFGEISPLWQNFKNIW